MDIILILLPACLIFSGLAVAAFFWAVKSGQMDDLETPAIRMLFDDEKVAGKRAMKNELNDKAEGSSINHMETGKSSMPTGTRKGMDE